jgi:hypothetical protein
MHRIMNVTIVCAIAAFFFVTTASATVIGSLNISSGNALATASGTSIAWGCDTTAGGTALATGFTCAQSQVGSGTTLSSTGGTPAVNSGVFIKDFNIGTTIPIANFMQLDNSTGTAIAISVNLTGFGTLPPSNCSTALFATCVVFNGEPLQLSNTSSGVTATLGVFGTATDSSSNVSNFSGSFTTQLTTMSTGITGTGAGGALTNADIQAFFGCPSGASGPGVCSPTALLKTISSTHSGTFQATFTAVPEPQTTALVLGGLLVLLGRVGMRRFNRSR